MTDPAAGVLKGALSPLLLEPLLAFGAEDVSGRFIIDNPLYSELLRVRRCVCGVAGRVKVMTAVGGWLEVTVLAIMCCSAAHAWAGLSVCVCVCVCLSVCP